jgi:hypothetical protein
MSIVFHIMGAVSECPRCYDSPSQTIGSELHCNACGLVFSKKAITQTDYKEKTSKSILPTQNSTTIFITPFDTIQDFTRVRFIECSLNKSFIEQTAVAYLYKDLSEYLGDSAQLFQQSLPQAVSLLEGLSRDLYSQLKAHQKQEREHVSAGRGSSTSCRHNRSI